MPSIFFYPFWPSALPKMSVKGKVEKPPFKHPVITSPRRFCPEDIKAAVFRPMVRGCSIMIEGQI